MLMRLIRGALEGYAAGRAYEEGSREGPRWNARYASSCSNSVREKMLNYSGEDTHAGDTPMLCLDVGPRNWAADHWEAEEQIVLVQFRGWNSEWLTWYGTAGRQDVTAGQQERTRQCDSFDSNDRSGGNRNK
jgi:hypothetical protein